MRRPNDVAVASQAERRDVGAVGEVAARVGGLDAVMLCAEREGTVRHVHIKDGTLSKQPGVTWGEEVPFGHGQVGPRRFFDALHDVGYRGPLVIEREAGNNRRADVGTAIDAIRANL